MSATSIIEGVPKLDRALALRAGLTQAAAVAAVSIALAIAFPRTFFEDWGWLAGPGAWMACAVLTATALRLPVASTLLGAALAGLPSLLAVAAGVHWLGAVVAVALFALWCGALAGREGASARA